MKSIGRTLGVLTILVTEAFHGSTAFGFELDPNQLRGDSETKPVSVLQNRYFLKAWRPEVGFAMGSFLNEAYTDTVAYGVRGSLFVSEWFGFEGQYFKTNVDDSDDRRALNKLTYRKRDEDVIVSPDPEINPISEIQDVTAIFAPFYGKLNLMDKVILYSDLYVTGGLVSVKTGQGRINGYSLGAGQRFYFAKNLSFRIDFKDRIYTEKRSGEDSTKNALSIDMGASYFFR